MAFQTPITIKAACDNMHARKYILPDIQREFVWSANQIECLFDSLMRGYPIGSFLFWKIDEKHKASFRFYDFIRDYHERDKRHNPIASTKKTDSLTAILDGQQRLTALYIALRGSYAYKKKYLAKDDPNAYPKRFLYLDVVNTSEEESDEDDRESLLYNFKFLEASEAKDKRWFKVGKILDFKQLSDVNNYLNEKKLKSGILENFYEIIIRHNIINFYEETHSDIDQVLDIFVRTNSGGTILSKSDLLLSTVTARWKDDKTGESARDKIINFVDEINNIGEGFDFSKDFVLKCCLMLADLNVKFSAKNLTKTNIDNISASWVTIQESIKASVNLVAKYFSRKELTSTNVVIPIAYYFMKNQSSNALTDESNQFMKKWMVISLIKGFFGGSSDTVLTKVRKIIKDSIDKDSNIFPWQDLKKEFSGGNKTLDIHKSDIESMLDNTRLTFSILTILYPDVNLKENIEIDHIFPQDFFELSNIRNKIEQPYAIKDYTDRKDRVANLQFLSKNENMEKSNKEPLKWLEKMCGNDDNKIRKWKEKNYVGDLSLGIENFLIFYEQRREKLIIKLLEALNN